MTSSSVTQVSGFRRSACAFSSSRRTGSATRSEIRCEHLRVARAQTREPFRAEPRVRRVGWLGLRLSCPVPARRPVPVHSCSGIFRLGGFDRSASRGFGGRELSRAVRQAESTGPRRAAGAARGRTRRRRLDRLPRLVGWRALALQDPRPFELDPGVQLLDEADRVLVERCPADLDSRRGPEPIKDARPRTAAPAIGIDDEGVLVTALVAIEPQIRQNYFLFFVRPGQPSARPRPPGDLERHWLLLRATGAPRRLLRVAAAADWVRAVRTLLRARRGRAAGRRLAGAGGND